MYTLKGKYTSANVMLPEGIFADESTTSQIYSFLNHPAFKGCYIAIMPDCHAGNGACVGFTMKINDYIIPAIVGVDIGCRVRTVRLSKSIPTNSRDKLDSLVRRTIPSGFNTHKGNTSSGIGNLFDEKIKVYSKIAGGDINRNINSIGSLGGGNHFIELGVDSNNKQWLTVHSGSRRFGLDIATYHQKRAVSHLRNNFIKDIPKGLEFLYEDTLYLEHMKFAQEFAKSNVDRILELLLKSIKIEFGNIYYDDDIESVHNYIGDDNIIRKGAVSAYKGERVVIPFNMEDGLIIGEGLGSSKWNNSAPHGAGRVMSRTRAKALLNLDEAKEDMKSAGVYSSNIPLDEVKGAYKDKELILNAIHETAKIIDFIRPIYNFKA